MAAPRAHCREIIVGKLPGDNAVAAITGASVLVCARGTSTPIAQTIYAAATGGTTLANPLSSDASGIVEFWVPVEQSVDLIITIQGFGSQTVTCECLVALESGAVNLNTTQALVNPGDVMVSTESLTWQGAASAHTAMSLNEAQTVAAVKTLSSAGAIVLQSGAYIDASAASPAGGLVLPSAAGAAPLADGQIGFDTTAHRPVVGENGATQTLATIDGSETPTRKTIDTAGPNVIRVNGNTLAAAAGSATVTLPNSTDTLVGLATTDTLTNKTLTAPTITGAASITSTGTTDLSGAASKAFKVLDVVFTDEAAPAAPGAGKTAIYAVAGVPHYRAGAAGADTSLASVLGVIGPTFAVADVTMTVAGTYYTGATLASALVNGGTYLISGTINITSAGPADNFNFRLYDSTNSVVIAELGLKANSTAGENSYSFGPVGYSGFAGTPTIVIQADDVTTGGSVINHTQATASKATWVQAVRVS